MTRTTYFIGQVLPPNQIPVIEDIYTVGPERWYVVQTNPNCERRAEGGLREIGLSSVYLPRLQRWRKVPRPKPGQPSREAIDAPMFPGYVLIGSDRAAGPHWGKIRGVDGVRRVLGVCGLPEPLPNRFVHDVRMIEADDHRTFTQPRHSFKAGEPLTITDGPFAPYAARFKKMKDADRSRILVAMFGRETEMVVPTSILQRVA